MGNILDELLLLFKVNSCGVFLVSTLKTLKLTAPLKMYFKTACTEETSSSFNLHLAGAKCNSIVLRYKLEGMIILLKRSLHVSELLCGSIEANTEARNRRAMRQTIGITVNFTYFSNYTRATYVS